MNSTKEAEYIAEIVALKSKVKTLSLKASKISEINAQLEIIDTLDCVEWGFFQPKTEAVNIAPSLLQHTITAREYTPPRIICRLIKPVE